MTCFDFDGQSALLAVVQSQLMGVFKQNLGPSESKIREALLILNYIALICSIGATMTSLLLSDEFSEIPMRSARAAALATDNPDVIVATNWRVLLYWHVKPKTKVLVWHCKYISAKLNSTVYIILPQGS
jgi:hypothetical protein